MPWHKPYQPSKNVRLETRLYTQAGVVCFITIRGYHNQSPFVCPALNQVIIDTLSEEQPRQRCSVFTYCLMPDHLHFLVSPQCDGASVLTFTDQYKGKATNRSWTVGWVGKLWEPR